MQEYFILFSAVNAVILRFCFSSNVCRGIPRTQLHGWLESLKRLVVCIAGWAPYLCKYWEQISLSQEGNSFMSSQWACSHGTWWKWISSAKGKGLHRSAPALLVGSAVFCRSHLLLSSWLKTCLTEAASPGCCWLHRIPLPAFSPQTLVELLL